MPLPSGWAAGSPSRQTVLLRAIGQRSVTRPDMEGGQDVLAKITNESFTEGDLSMQVNKNLGMLLLGIWLVLTGLIQLLNFGFSGLYVIMALLAIAAGVLIGVGR
jgi:hypothetical protein